MTTKKEHLRALALRGLDLSDNYRETQEIKNLILKKGGRVAEIGDACLNNDTVSELEDGGFLLEVWRYANEWGNTPEYRIFDDLESALDYYQEHYTDRASEWGRASLDEWEQSDGVRPDTAPLEEWRDLCECVMCA